MREIPAVDLRLVSLLSENGRMSNASLAARLGIAASTCHGRLLALTRTGVIRGFHADVDPARVGRSVQAMIAVRLSNDARGRLAAFARYLAELPDVLNVYFLGGADDFQVHLATRDPSSLRDFVLRHLSDRPEVASTTTNLVFSHLRGRHPLVGALDDSGERPHGSPARQRAAR